MEKVFASNIFEFIMLFIVFLSAHKMENRDNFYVLWNTLHVLAVSFYGVANYYQGKRYMLREKENESFTR